MVGSSVALRLAFLGGKHHGWPCDGSEGSVLWRK